MYGFSRTRVKNIYNFHIMNTPDSLHKQSICKICIVYAKLGFACFITRMKSGTFFVHAEGFVLSIFRTGIR